MDDDDDELAWGRSGKECCACGDRLVYTEEVFLLEICAARMINAQLDWGPILFDGSYAFSPCLLHFICWERILEEVREITQDVPPHDAKDPVMICTVCESLIGAEETFISTTYAELHVSRRCPSGQSTDRVEPMSTPEPVCLECMANVVEDYFPAWEDVLHYMPDGYLDEERDGT